MTTIIARWGNSRGIRLPKPFLESVNLKENDTVDVQIENNAIIIRKSEQQKHKSVKQRVEGFYKKDFESVLTENPYEYEEVDWGHPVGDEVW